MKLYHYDHCPYCAKARMIFGLKNVNFESVILLNDDEATPIRMTGIKALPILEKDDGTFMPESLDIISYVDNNYGGEKIVSYHNPRTEIQDWVYSSRNFAYELAMPRWVQMPLQEFNTIASREYFQNKKQNKSIGLFSVALEETPNLIKKAESELKYLENLMLDNGRFYSEEIHIDDFHVFGILRNLSTTKDLKWPPKVLSYLERLAEQSKVNLFFDLAI